MKITLNETDAIKNLMKDFSKFFYLVKRSCLQIIFPKFTA